MTPVNVPLLVGILVVVVGGGVLALWYGEHDMKRGQK